MKMSNKNNKFLLVEDTNIPEMHLRHPGFTYSACEAFTQKNKTRYKRLKKQGTPVIYIGMNKTKLVFSLIWHMMISKIYQDEL